MYVHVQCIFVKGGSIEPVLISLSDHQVIMGNHRDAWVFGAVDPNSGTAVLMEMARSFSILRQNSKSYILRLRAEGGTCR